MPEGEPSHAEMIAAYREVLDDQEKIAHIFPDGPAALRIAKLRAVLLHLERTAWRPIEEAPMTNGTESLLYDADSECISIGYMSFAGWTLTANGEVAAHLPYAKHEEATPIKCKPTHWMPLPPSPETPR